MTDFEAPDKRNLLLAHGKLLLALIVNGVRGEFRDCGEVSNLTRATDDSKIQFRTHRTADSRIVAEDTKERTITYKAELNEFTRRLVALHVMGDEITISQAGGDVTDEVLVEAVVLGGIYPLAQRDVSAVALHYATISGTALVEGVDFEVFNAAAGLIKILPTATVVMAGDKIYADYTAAAHTGASALAGIAGGTESQPEVSLWFVGENIRGQNREVRVWRAASNSDGDLPFITDDYGKFTLDFVVLDDSDGNFGGSATVPLDQVLDLD